MGNAQVAYPCENGESNRIIRGVFRFYSRRGRLQGRDFLNSKLCAMRKRAQALSWLAC